MILSMVIVIVMMIMVILHYDHGYGQRGYVTQPKTATTADPSANLPTKIAAATMTGNNAVIAAVTNSMAVPINTVSATASKAARTNPKSQFPVK